MELLETTLNSGQFDSIFPFHLTIAADGRIEHAGSSLLRLLPELSGLPHFTDVFRIIRPNLEFSVPALVEGHRLLFLVEVVRTGMSLRGQMLPQEGNRVIFLASPWLSDSDQLSRFQLKIEDYAIHDPALDLLQAMQAQRMVLSDLQRLNERLERQRSELAIVNARLSEQNETLRTAQARLETSEAETRTLALVAARTSNAVVLTDPQGRIEWVNEGFTRLTGFTKDEVVGRSPGSLLQGPETDPATIARMRDHLASQRGFTTEVLNYSKLGRKYWVSIEVQPIRDAQGGVCRYMAIESEITDRIEADRRRTVQFEVSRILAETETLQRGIARVIQSIASRFGWEFAAFWAVDQSHGHPVFKTNQIWHSASADLEEFSDLSRLLHLHPGEELPGRVWSTGSAVWVHDYPANTEFTRAPHARRAKLRGALAFPCKAEGIVLGIMEFFSPEPGEPDEDLLRLLSAIGAQVGQFLVRKHANAELERQRNLALQIMNAMGQGLTVTDERGHFTFVNEAYARMVGRSAEDLVGMTPGDLSPEEDRDRLIAARAARLRGESSSYEIQVKRSDGSITHALVSGVPRWENGRVMGSITTITDVSDRKRMEEQLVANLERERELNEMKSHFVSMASHELRTPLATLSLTADLLGTHLGRLGPERIDSNLQTIREAARQLRAILDDLLFVGRGEQGKIQCKPEVVNLGELLNRLVSEVSAEDRKRHPVQVAIEGSPLVLSLDPQLVRHILVNLLSNACKYSAEGSQVTVGVRLCDRQLEIQVADQGIGIPVEDQKKIFSYFYRAKNVGETAGTGLGLLVVKQCVEAHGGWIEFSSTPGSGTRFTLRLPVP